MELPVRLLLVVGGLLAVGGLVYRRFSVGPSSVLKDDNGLQTGPEKALSQQKERLEDLQWRSVGGIVGGLLLALVVPARNRYLVFSALIGAAVFAVTWGVLEARKLFVDIALDELKFNRRSDGD